IDIRKPSFSWQLTGQERNLLQTAFEIRVGTNMATLSKGKNIVWNSGKVATDESLHNLYAGPELESAKKYFWQARVWDNKGKTSAWSEVAHWQMGLLNESDWQAKWISIGFQEDSVVRPGQLLRKEFNTTKKVQSATAFITSHGMYEAFINGKRVGDYYLTPGWTSYNKRLQYQAYDVTSLLTTGKNAIGASLASGWYRTPLAWESNVNLYGKELALLAQLRVVYEDGTVETIGTDDTWKSSKGAVISSELYDGEYYDANLEKVGWTSVSYDDKGWLPVKVKDYPKNILLATYNEPVKKHEKFKAVKVITTPKGEKVIDFGQNLVGLVEVTASGTKGDSIKIYHSEILDKAGNFYTENLRGAKQLNTYVLKGEGVEKFEPHFTFQGFRYIRIEGLKGELKPENFTAVAMYSDMKPTGNFKTSSQLINQLQHNIQWGQKGNFLDVPTDCPQRDERLGWTGDAQAFARTATYNMNVYNFFSKWLKDLAADQTDKGSVPHVIPNVLGKDANGSAGWADAATIIPWTIYTAYGDKRILEQQYASMKAWVGFMEANSTNNLWNKGFHFGDWLFYRPDDDNSGVGAITDKYMIAQCFYSNSVQIMINAAKVLNKPDDVKKYQQLLNDVKNAYVKEYLTASGRLVSSTQTAYVLALNFDMLPDSLRKQAAQRLADNIKTYNNHLTTGFLGTPYLCHVLSRFGYTDVAFKLLMQETYPSWLYPVKQGATTIWERWDGQKPDGSFQTPGMNSFNHYAYGAIGDWMYRVIAGMDTYDSMPGYKKISIKPHIGGGLTDVAADYETNYGKLSSRWQIVNGKFALAVEIPANTTAKIYIPASGVESVTEGGKTLNAVSDLKVSGKDGDYVIVDVGSGVYNFKVN
ncbi:MAG TPA: family 78 glycoside hydrolase catalytic domain, partial [Flavitalea sp.]|nr:family 78 glycoside hydrolase catalytic domain [Flavitalea sp.]